jgi:hypothetical protein
MVKRYHPFFIFLFLNKNTRVGASGTGFALLLSGCIGKITSFDLSV